MKKFVLYLFLLLLLSQAYLSSGSADRKILIKKYFRNRHTYIIICRGYPKKGVVGRKKMITAKEAALIHAQFIARGIFNKTVNVFKSGEAFKYKIYRNFAVVYFRIKKWNLRYRVKKKKFR